MQKPLPCPDKNEKNKSELNTFNNEEISQIVRPEMPFIQPQKKPL